MAQTLRAHNGAWEMINDSKTHNSEDKVLFGLRDLNIERSFFF